MASKDKMCPYQDKHGDRGLAVSSRAVEISEKNWKQKRVRVKCPECGRRMWGWCVISHDGEILHYAVPPHKKKGWWKKKKRRGE